jgi:nucleotide-binding universal stress UspA family protein
MFQSIVVGTDGSETATRAVERAGALAEQLRCPVHVVSAYEPVRDAELRHESEGAPADLVFHAREEVDRVLERAAALFDGESLDVRLHARRGEAARAILDVAKEESAQLIVVGNRGMTGVRRFLLGSVPNTISHHAACDVMIVRTAG